LRTIFNMLGPLTNPAGAGACSSASSTTLCRPIAEVLLRLGAVHALVVHGEDGLDEFSLATRTHVVEARDEALADFTAACTARM
jgi:anthranilate phosphoribosyltransferase